MFWYALCASYLVSIDKQPAKVFASSQQSVESTTSSTSVSVVKPKRFKAPQRVAPIEPQPSIEEKMSHTIAEPVVRGRYLVTEDVLDDIGGTSESSQPTTIPSSYKDPFVTAYTEAISEPADPFVQYEHEQYVVEPASHMPAPSPPVHAQPSEVSQPRTTEELLSLFDQWPINWSIKAHKFYALDNIMSFK